MVLIHNQNHLTEIMSTQNAGGGAIKKGWVSSSRWIAHRFTACLVFSGMTGSATGVMPT
jgi:hypothetical protein